MAKTEKMQRQKTVSVKLRKKKNESGSRSLYLQVRVEGRVTKEYLGITLEGSDRSEENKKKMAIANAARSARETELLVHKKNLPGHLAPKEEDTYSFMREKSKRRERGTKGVVETLIGKLRAFSKKDVLPLSSIDKPFVLGFMDFLCEQVSEGTAYISFYYFSSFLNRACEEDLIKENPIRKIPKEQRLRRGQERLEFLTLQQIEHLIGHSEGIHPQVRLGFIFSCFTGLRWSDLHRVRFDQISQEIIEGKVWSILSYQQKKTKKITVVPLNVWAEEVLRERREAMKEEGISPYLFPELMGTDEDSKSKHVWSHYQLARWGKQAEIGKKLHWHLGRHTFGTLTYLFSKDIHTTSHLLGHSDIKMTMRYTHAMNEAKVSAMLKVSEATQEFRDNKDKLRSA